MRTGIAKFNIHITNETCKIGVAATPKKENKNTATEPFTTISKTENIGTMEATKYIDQIIVIAVK